MEINKRMNEILEERGMSRYSLSQAIGTTYSVVWRWMSDDRQQDKRQPAAYYIPKICEALNISADYLLGLTDEKRKLHEE